MNVAIWYRIKRKLMNKNQDEQYERNMHILRHYTMSCKAAGPLVFEGKYIATTNVWALQAAQYECENGH